MGIMWVFKDDGGKRKGITLWNWRESHYGTTRVYTVEHVYYKNDCIVNEVPKLRHLSI